MHVLNIPVSPDVLARWAEWLAPPMQPFFLSEAEATAFDLPTLVYAEWNPSPELRDTFALWGLSAAAHRVSLLSEADWNGLSLSVRRQLLRLQIAYGRGNLPRAKAFADLLPEPQRGRFVWWSSMLTPEIVARAVSAESLACQREQVPDAVWQAAEALLPRARALAGTFAGGSGPNCFGTVMAAAGIAGAELEWMQRDPFEAFLAARTRSGGKDDRPGTLLVWRGAGGQVEHAAVTLGGDWALHKPSQSWMTPRVVLPTRALIRAYRTPGHRLERHRLN
ncbi:hypothetical protein [Deinococcus puniceus]|uniref:Uncharacterized protein n=1 Tax=Deinococcus puniceus TaxID=1182568 RepID=A0A172T7T5_9DEIO|nr:hypothetical protein [Deinococcus puniceus]ANE42883.1 hypothetical protein SU48_02880 [Deinococcus puniceus]